VQRGASVRWTGFVDRWASRPVRLPPSADFATLARQWAERVGGDRVHVLLADETATVTHRAAREVLCLAPDDRQPGGSALRPRWRDLAPAQSDLLRRVNSVLNVRAEDDTRATARARLLSSLRDTGRPHDLTVPAAHRGWVADRARALADDLRAGGYPVHGDLDRLVPARGRRPGRPVVADVLASALDACLDLAAGNEQLRRAVRR
jgi:hypothetical protein